MSYGSGDRETGRLLSVWKVSVLMSLKNFRSFKFQCVSMFKGIPEYIRCNSLSQHF